MTEFDAILGRAVNRVPSTAAARSELTWAVLGIGLLGLLSMGAILARGGDPLRWSAAAGAGEHAAEVRSAKKVKAQKHVA